MENFVNEEFFEQMSPLMKHVRILYCFMGGIFYENYVTRKFAYLIRGFAIIIYFSTTIGCIIRFNRPESNFVVKEDALGQLIFLHVCVMMALIAYMKRDSFHALFDHMEEGERISHRTVSWKSNSAQDEFEESNVEDFNFKFGKYYAVWLVITFLGKLFQKLITLDPYEEFCVDYNWDFFWSFPFTSSQTLLSYFSVLSLTYSFFVFVALLIYGSLVLPFLLSMHLANQTKRLLSDIKYHTDLAYECLEECFRREQILMEEANSDETFHHFQLREIERKRERYVKEFMIKVYQWIDIHQTLIQYAELLKKCTSTILTIQVVGFYMAIVHSGYLFSKAILDSEEIQTSIVFTLFIFTNAIVLLMACMIGNTFCETSEALPTAIYSMPWYHLPKTHQKELLNFMCLAQKTNEILILNVFPLTLELYPTILNDAYGYVQLMRVLEMKHNR